MHTLPKKNLEEFRASYLSKRLMWVAISATGVLTVLGQLISFVIGDKNSLGGSPGIAAPWVLASIVVMLLFATRAQLTRSEDSTIPKVYWIQGMVQYTWMAILSFYTTPAFSIVIILVLAALTFNDAHVLWNHRQLKRSYMLIVPAQLCVLLGIDLFGGSGLIERWEFAERSMTLMLSIEVCLIWLLILVIEHVGATEREKFLATEKAIGIERDLNAAKIEKATIAKTCQFFLHGLTATRFSHDVASPLSAIGIHLERLRQLCGSLEAQQHIDEIRTSNDQLLSLTRDMAMSVRTPPQLEMLPIEQLIDEALIHGEYLLDTRLTDRIDIDAQPADVYVSRDHVAAIAGILHNSGKFAGTSIELRGQTADAYFYLLEIRDIPSTVERSDINVVHVREMMGFGDVPANTKTSDSIDSVAKRGYGISLLLTKAVIARHGGWLNVDFAAPGRELVFQILLPRCAEIPKEHDRPEEWIAERIVKH